ncbi:MotB3 [Desulforapulum autotrophicum HRM2]|uniref:MotB3 n=1 Tax=Desulforapulum autotrophicum (strain ATCC 43914 / DSM 3382 / VKM B-1955 / HRM2) TaxID=177437 RepID=C0QA09_DESAH|nr:flagellar motor protein MotB [Desulforapulum autotrophicum]ACN16727.1 MotB3 [Desulforapulum autotrophicum HRM2]
MDKESNGNSGSKNNLNNTPLNGGGREGVSGQGFDPFSENLLFSFETPRRGGWSVSWSDLMMTMFILFVVMYVYQAGSRELEFGPGPGTNLVSDSGSGKIVENSLNASPSDVFTQTRQAVLDEFVDDSASVELVADRAVRISLAGDLFFDLGKADLKPQAQWRLRQIGRILQENSFVVNVIGHTDDMPNHSEQYPTNWELSTARACRVARFLIKEAQLPEERFFVSGHAWLQPLRPNNTAHNRSLNRRVEIVLMKERPYSEGSQFNSEGDNNG